MKTEIGQMNKRIVFRSVFKIADDSAGKLPAINDWFTSWAQVKKISGQRAFDSGFDGLIDNYDVWIRYRLEVDDITKDTRVTWNGKDHGIKTFERIDNNGDVQTTGNIFHFVMTTVN